MRALGLLFFLLNGCVLKAQYDDSIVKQMKCEEELKGTTTERDQLRTKLADLQKQNSDLDLRNNELAQTNQMLSNKNTEYTQKSVDNQKQLVKLREENDKTTAKTDYLTKVFAELEKTAKEAIPQAEITKTDNEIHLQFPENVVFPKEGDQIQSKGKSALTLLAGTLRKVSSPISVEVHTDELKTSGMLRRKYSTNWELSAARATKIVRFLETQGLDGDKLLAVGRGDRHVAPEPRRIEISILPPPSKS